MENKSSNYTGLGILDVVQIVFIILKLIGVITWSWTVVLIPLWIILGIIAAIATIGIFIDLKYLNKWRFK